MARRKVSLRAVFLPSDSIAFLVILLGLFVALFLDEMAVRLIGVCIAVLGGVALFMMVSPRLTEISMPRPPRPTESPLFMSQTTREGNQTRQVFDSQAYRATFGASEAGLDEELDERQIGLFPELMDTPPERDLPAAPVLVTPVSELMEIDFADGQSSVRLVGVRSTRGIRPATPPLAIESRTKRSLIQQELAAAQQNDEASRQPPAVSRDLVITGKVTDEVQISDEVKVRPKGTLTTPAEPSTPTVDVSPPIVETDAPAHVVQPQPETIAEPTPEPEEAPRKEIRVSAFMLDDDEEMEPSEEPRKEFDYLLNRVLMVIRSATSARTAAFFWFNRDRQQLVLEAWISDAVDQFTDQRKIPIGTDVVSQIALEGRPEIITEITSAAELSLLPYYKYRAGTVSFVGVPVYFQGNVVGVLCADTKEQNAYTDVTVGFFGHFTKLIGGLVLSYTSKYDLQQNARTMEAILQFRAAVADGEPSITVIVRSLFDVIIKQMDISTIGVCAYNPQQRIWTVRDAKSVIPEYGQLVGAPVDLGNSLVGECIRNGESIAVSVESNAIRVTPSEPEIDLCQLVALPMRSLQHTHGALFIENHKGTITNQDVATAELLADLAGEMIAGIRESERDSVETVEVGNDQTVASEVDEEDLIYRIREEVARSTDYGVPLTLCYVMVDTLVGALPEDQPAIMDVIMNRIQGRIREQVREYDVVGPITDNTIAVALVAYNAQEAQFWTESLRRDVANNTVEAQGKNWSSTISIGVAQLKPGDTWQVLMENVQTALDISARVKNKVTVYS